MRHQWKVLVVASVVIAGLATASYTRHASASRAPLADTHRYDYNVTVLTYRDDLVLPAAINNAGQITGALTVGAHMHAFIYDHGRVRDLGTLPGYTDSRAYAINDRGDVAGTASIINKAGSPPRTRAFLYAHGHLTGLGTLPGYADSTGNSLNNLDIVVGDSSRSESWDAQAHSFLWRNGRMCDLGTFGGRNSSAAAINNAGQIVGSAQTASTDFHPFIATLSGAPRDINGGGSSYGAALAINDTGIVAELAMLGRAGSGLSLVLCNASSFAPSCRAEGPVGSSDQVTISGINARGDVVGVHDIGDTFGPFIAHDDQIQTLQNVVPPTITLGPAIMGGINNAGVIVAGCQTQTGPDTTCILTPP